MRTDIFLPKKLKVGFQNRNGTYTGKLAYIIYFDAKGVLRKENSWNSWRSDSIPPMDIENVPMSGFVLNKKAGGYSSGWNHRQTYVRIYDPRGFEFEISVQNLLYILENTNCIKGKGLEGEFVYGWSGTELILIPTSSPDYEELTEFNEALQSTGKIKAKELILGATYRTRQNETVIYLGRYEHANGGTYEGKKYFFYNVGSKSSYSDFTKLKSLGDKIVSVITEECDPNYAELVDKLQKSKEYSPHDPSKTKYIPYTFEDFKNKIKKKNNYYSTEFLTNKKEKISVSKQRNYSYWNQQATENDIYEVQKGRRYEKVFSGKLEDIFEEYQPISVDLYLPDGKLYKRNVSI